jgi:hypothetical protein
MPKAMNRNALTQIKGGQKILAFVGFTFRPDVVKTSGASARFTGLLYLYKLASMSTFSYYPID